MAASETAAVYRLYASHCVEIAQDTTSPDRRAALLTIAQAWLGLADQAEKNSDVVLVYETPTPRTAPSPMQSQQVAQQQQQPQPKK
jgi:hypothetical protein